MTDVAGVVAGVGPGVNDFAVGDQVVAMLNSMVSSFHSCVMFFGLPFQLNNIMPCKKKKTLNYIMKINTSLSVQSYLGVHLNFKVNQYLNIPPVATERRWIGRVRRGGSEPDRQEDTQRLSGRGRRAAHRGGHGAAGAEVHRRQVRRHRRAAERAGHRRLGRRGPLRRAAGQAGEPPRDGHLRRPQRGAREGPGRRRGAGLPDARGRRHAQPLGEEVRRRRALHRRRRVAGVRAADGAPREGDRHHAQLLSHAHLGAARGDAAAEAAGAAAAVAEQGRPGVLGRAGGGREAQDGGGLEVPAGRRGEGVAEEHRRPRHRQDSR